MRKRVHRALALLLAVGTLLLTPTLEAFALSWEGSSAGGGGEGGFATTKGFSIRYADVGTNCLLRKGGRLPAAVAVAGGMLGIKPLITIKEGKVAMAGKARGLPGAYVALFKKIEELGGVNPRFPSLAGYTISPREVNPIQTYLVDNLGLPEPLVRQIGCVIGTHAGPGAFGLAFFDNGLVID